MPTYVRQRLVLTFVRTRGCECGRLRCESAGKPLGLHVCHCRECQKQSASAFGMSLPMPCSGSSLTAGEPRA
ncbi:GFA family protein [Mangrovibrevibacter kandeliae]|uniref:GFA family protein n=1 Tax=Mangrovibrevibacter kandeliae TaxID=2968473 RepID=UPI004038C8B9